MKSALTLLSCTSTMTRVATSELTRIRTTTNRARSQFTLLILLLSIPMIPSMTSKTRRFRTTCRSRRSMEPYIRQRRTAMASAPGTAMYLHPTRSRRRSATSPPARPLPFSSPRPWNFALPSIYRKAREHQRRMPQRISTGILSEAETKTQRVTPSPMDTPTRNGSVERMAPTLLSRPKVTASKLLKEVTTLPPSAPVHLVDFTQAHLVTIPDSSSAFESDDVAFIVGLSDRSVCLFSSSR